MALLIASATASAQVYRWVDDEGQTHYSDTPPPATAKGSLTELDDLDSHFTTIGDSGLREGEKALLAAAAARREAERERRAEQRAATRTVFVTLPEDDDDDDDVRYYRPYYPLYGYPFNDRLIDKRRYRHESVGAALSITIGNDGRRHHDAAPHYPRGRHQGHNRNLREERQERAAPQQRRQATARASGSAKGAPYRAQRLGSLRRR